MREVFQLEINAAENEEAVMRVKAIEQIGPTIGIRAEEGGKEVFIQILDDLPFDETGILDIISRRFEELENPIEENEENVEERVEFVGIEEFDVASEPIEISTEKMNRVAAKITEYQKYIMRDFPRIKGEFDEGLFDLQGG